MSLHAWLTLPVVVPACGKVMMVGACDPVQAHSAGMNLRWRGDETGDVVLRLARQADVLGVSRVDQVPEPILRAICDSDRQQLRAS
jgi:hypothetical protein